MGDEGWGDLGSVLKSEKKEIFYIVWGDPLEQPTLLMQEREGQKDESPCMGQRAPCACT